ncbi:hypothetical protein BH10PSE19_BH10PSE19_17390 [soil metagenome]
MFQRRSPAKTPLAAPLALHTSGSRGTVAELS